jgi:23S rRNA pseudouridine1911/1915/1917 synthase
VEYPRGLSCIECVVPEFTQKSRVDGVLADLLRNHKIGDQGFSRSFIQSLIQKGYLWQCTRLCANKGLGLIDPYFLPLQELKDQPSFFSQEFLDSQALSTKDSLILKEGNWKLIPECSYLANAWEIYRLYIPPTTSSALLPQAMDLNIVYEDRHLLVVNKRAGLVVHPGAGHWQGTLVHGLLHHCGDSLSGINGVQKPGIIHRLDKGTSGLMVVAKNDKAHQNIAQQFTQRSVQKVYWALCQGFGPLAEQCFQGFMGRHPWDRQKMAVLENGQGRFSSTYYHNKEYSPSYHVTLMECRLETGRTHQIRLHMAHKGFPLIFDEKYGPKKINPKLKTLSSWENWPAEALGLHSKYLAFNHPEDGTALVFEVPPPGYFQEFLQQALGQ